MTYLISRFKATVILASLLHGVVREVNHAVCRVFHIVLSAAGAQVSVLIPISLEVAVDSRGQCIAADVELTVLVEQGTLDILLNDKAAPVATDMLSLDQLFYMIQITADLDATPSVSVLAGLHDPEAVAVLGVLLKHFVSLRIVVGLHKLEELTVVLTLFNVIRQWKLVERILALAFIKDFHVVVDGLLVAEMEVVLLMVARDHVMTGRILFLLLLLLIVVFALATDVGATSALLQAFVTAGGNASICLFQC